MGVLPTLHLITAVSFGISISPFHLWCLGFKMPRQPNWPNEEANKELRKQKSKCENFSGTLNGEQAVFYWGVS